MGLDIAKMFSDFGEAYEELQKPMTLEEAINFLDPENVSFISENSAARIARTTKAKGIVVKYAREQMEKKKQVGEMKKCPFCGCEITTKKEGYPIYGEHKEFCYFQILDNQNRYDFTKSDDLEKLKTAWNERS